MTHGVICAAQPEAAEAGALILKRGGNAIDAGIAAALVQGVVDPLMCGLGGVGSALVRQAGSTEPENVNFLGAAPAAARADMWADRIQGETGDGFGFVLAGRVNALGHQAAMVPAALKGYGEIWQRLGSMDWAALCRPAIEAADSGWVVRPHVYAYATQDEGAQGRVHNAEILGYTGHGRDLYLGPDGQMKRPGTPIRNPDLAATLRIIAEEGVEAFYRGPIGDRIAADMAANGGLIDGADLAACAVDWQPALPGRFRGLEVYSNRPGGSGVQLIETLNILEQFDPGELPHGSPEHLRVTAEALAYAYNDKRIKVGDPRFVQAPLAALTSKSYAADLSARIRDGAFAELQRLEDTAEARGTTQVCSIDEHGNALTMTHTLGAPSGVIPPGCGFMLNGCMAIFDPRPGLATSIAPGKSYTSSMSPAMLFADGAPALVIGAPGATYIPQAISQAIVNVVDYGMAMLPAVAAPRIAVTRNRTIDVSNRIPRFVTRELEARGYRIQRSYLSYAFAGVHGIRVGTGGWDGAADPGRDGSALVV